MTAWIRLASVKVNCLISNELCAERQELQDGTRPVVGFQ